MKLDKGGWKLFREKTTMLLLVVILANGLNITTKHHIQVTIKVTIQASFHYCLQYHQYVV